MKSVHPDGTGLNLMVKVLSSKQVTEAKSTAREVVVGDQTGTVKLRVINEEHAKVCQDGASIRIQNARVMMINGFIRVIVDKWGVLRAADTVLDFEVNADTDVSATEFELKLEQ